MKKLILLLSITLSMSQLSAQNSGYCDKLRTKLNQAIDNNDVKNVKYRYDMLLHACGTTENDIQVVKKFYSTTSYSPVFFKDLTFSLYDNDKSTLSTKEYSDYEVISANPKTKIIVLQKNGRYKLIGPNKKVLIDDVEWIAEIGKYEETFYVVTLNNGSKSVYNSKGELALNGNEFSSVMTSNGPHAIVIKDGKWGVFNLSKKNYTIPLTSNTIQELYRGFFAIDTYGSYHIVDDENQVISKIPGNRLRVLNFGRIVIIDLNRKAGVYDLLGNEIIPCQYDDIKLDFTSNIIKAEKDKQEFTFDLNGNSIK